MSITIEGVEIWEERLGTDVRPLLRAGAMALAADLQNIIAPYPAAPRGNGRSWYERGFGPKWRLKDGTVRGRKTSQTMGRRWEIRPTPDGAELGNSASYSKLVHGTRTTPQAGVHRRTGWVSTKTAIGNVQRDGDVTLRLLEPVLQALGGDRNAE